MIKVGVTGGIGSGKSTVCKIFESLGAPVYHADDEGRKILEKREVISILVQYFGNSILDERDEIDRKKLAEIVFKDTSALAFLNSIIHTRVRASFQEWSSDKPDAPYVIYEAAILFESGHYKNVDKTVLVTASEEARIARVTARDNVSREAVLQRIGNQWDDQKKAAMADFIINNDGSVMLIPQVIEIHNQLLKIQ